MRVHYPLLIVMTVMAAFASLAARAEAVVGQPAPALVASTRDSKAFDLAALKGKVVIIHYWATWCAPCREEMPVLEAIWRTYHGKGMEMLAISADRPRAQADVDMVAHSFSFPIAMLNAISKNDFGNPTQLPMTYIIDKDGKVVSLLTPDTEILTEAGLSTTVKNLLDAKPADTKQADPKPDDKK